VGISVVAAVVEAGNNVRRAGAAGAVWRRACFAEYFNRSLFPRAGNSMRKIEITFALTPALSPRRGRNVSRRG